MRGAWCVDAPLVLALLLQVNNDRQQQEQNQEKNEASTYSMEQQMRQQSPSQVPSPPCMLATALSHQTGRPHSLERTAWGMHSKGCMGCSSLGPSLFLQV